MLRVLRYLWALPATLVGLLLAALALTLGARARPIGGALEVAGGRLAAWVRRLPAGCGFGAITFGHVILGLDAATLEHCRTHEHVHVRQYEKWGILFFPLYLGSSLAAWLRGQDPYLDNIFERQAFGECQRRIGRVESRASITSRP
jgi:hypothetical protein